MPEKSDGKLRPIVMTDPPKVVSPAVCDYAELDVVTNFSFLRGASHPDELVYTAALLGYRAMAVTDVNSVAGVVRAFEAALPITGFKLIVGCRLKFIDGTPDVLVWPMDRAAYGRLCRLLTAGRKRAPKGECHLTIADLLEWNEGLQAAVDLTPSPGIPVEGGGEGSVAKFKEDVIPSEASPQDPRPFPRIATEPSPYPLPEYRERDMLKRLRETFGDRLSLVATAMYDGDDESRLDNLAAVAKQTQIPLVATNHVHYHDRGRRMLQDVITCIRHCVTLAEAGRVLFPNGERYLKRPEQMVRTFAKYPEAIQRGLDIAEQCRFSLGELGYEYPSEAVPAGKSPTQHLRDLAYDGAKERYPDGIPPKVRELLEKELAFISGSKFEPYFLTVHDLVRYARSRGILCQGRGSAANSAVCYCLGVTSVDPAHFQLVFERFASPERKEPPDIDIDFEHERREEVIQYVYSKYGRDRAAMTASLITYRGRSAIRDVGKALGFSADLIDQLADKLDWWHSGTLMRSHLAEAGVDFDDPTIRMLVHLTGQLLGFPRHLSQHVGGMVVSRTRLDECVPVENAAMVDRTVIEWDKNDINVLGMFKVDLLSLGMLTCLSKSMKMINQSLQLHTIPHEDPEVYRMASDADTVGVFQIESRAQMSMLPRLRPEKFYDLVIEVAIVRPGPIQGDMVHPYLTRREALRKDPNYQVEYPSGKRKELESVLGQTLGVPLFQEQAMRLASMAAGFTGAEADALRRSMAAWKRGDGLHKFHDKFIHGMLANGYEKQFAEDCFNQISGFGEYGFPESHAASFAKLVYASAWIKRHHPAAFAAGLLNSQPMGFYSPAQIVRDAREHGVEVRPPDVNASDWDCTLEICGTGGPPVMPVLRHMSEAHQGNRVSETDLSYMNRPAADVVEYHDHGRAARATDGQPHKSTWGKGGPALRLGFRQIKGLREDLGHVIAHERQRGGAFESVEAFQVRTRLATAVIRRLAEADAFASLGMTRRQSAWETLRLRDEAAPVVERAVSKAERYAPYLPLMSPGQEVMTDYATVGLSLKRHPVAFVRPTLNQKKIVTTSMLADEKQCPHGKWVKVAGLVLVRQRPGTASGVVFVTLEDETGTANLILWSSVYERFRPAARHATLLQVDGYVQREGKVVHVLAKRLFDLSDLIRGLNQPSRDFH